ncbi:MAG TPA: SDR family oxidoreductase [Acidimicrobiales bacterium]|nr:SDR family oxidoreductase [Acidimicrobiales bacterium]
MDVTDKAAIVTGASSGVGAATARRLADLGCSVVINYASSADKAEAVAEDCRARGVDAFAHQADVADDGACVGLVEAAVERFGRLDVLVNNAGTTEFVPHHDLAGMESAAWDRILGVNLKGPFFCTRAARDHLKADGGGEVVMTSSVAGLAGTGSSIAYCASKAGLNNLTVTLARVMGPEVRVNAVAPGFIDGEWLQEGFGDAYEGIKAVVEGQSLLNRVSTPDDVAAAILSLITGSDLVTAHVLPVEGGALHRM